MLGSSFLFAQELPQLDDDESDTIEIYDIGDIGPAGGIIFYDKGSFSDGWRYLEAAPASSEFRATWGSPSRNVSGTTAAIGAGMQNTQLNIGSGSSAAQRCLQLDINGFTDWFLPSREELNLIYQNLKLNDLGDFSNSWYWSSTQHSQGSGWSQWFNGGSHSGNAKNSTASVRAIRTF